MPYAPELQQVLDREPSRPVTVRDVDYDVAGTPCRGVLAVPDGDGPHPAVLVIHDWLGVSDMVRMRCEMLARLGYAAFGGDVYGADTRPGPAEAAGVAHGFYGDPELWRTRVTGAFDAMTALPEVDGGRTAAIGYCFGGSSVLQLARTGADTTAVVSFHGGLSTGPEGEAERIRAALLVLTGADDPVVPPEAVDGFEDELRGTGVDWQVVTYAGAMHAFTVPGTDSPDHGAQFQATAERRSWQAMKDFFAELLPVG